MLYVHVIPVCLCHGTRTDTILKYNIQNFHQKVFGNSTLPEKLEKITNTLYEYLHALLCVSNITIYTYLSKQNIIHFLLRLTHSEKINQRKYLV